MIRYPYSKAHITDEDLAAIVNAASGIYLTQGEYLEKFERALAKYFGVTYVVVCNSGTAALHLLYHALGLRELDLAAVPSITFLATANAAKMCGAGVEFIDVDPSTGLVSPELFEKKLSESAQKIKLAVVVHLGGRVCNMPAIYEIAKKFGCLLVEDACHAPGAKYIDGSRERSVGSCAHSDGAIFSFHAIKHLTMGEGGALVTNNENVASRAKEMRNHGMIRDSSMQLNRPEKDAPWYYEMHNLGWNYRADEIACSLGLSQLNRLDDSIQKRQYLAELYCAFLKGVPCLNLPTMPTHKMSNVWHLYPISIDFSRLEISRGKFMSELSKLGIGTQVHYIPLHNQPYYLKNSDANKFRGADEYYSKTISLPMYPQLSIDDIQFISSEVKNLILNNLR